MQARKIQNNIEPAFGVKVSQNFIKVAHNHYNYNVQANKKQNIWRFNNRIDEYGKYGFDDYTLEYEQKIVNGYRKHFLIAKHDTNPKKNSVILNQSTLVKLVNKFLNMSENEFANTLKHRKG